MRVVTFGTWLGQQLKRHEWTQADLARKSGLTQGRISDWLNDKRRPNPASCDKLADALGESVDVVLAMAGHRPHAYDQDTPDQAAMISLIRKIRWTTDREEQIRSLLATMVAQDQRRRKA